MHDGSIPTLDAAVDHYANGGRVIADGPLAGDGRANPYKDPLISGIELTTARPGEPRRVPRVLDRPRRAHRQALLRPVQAPALRTGNRQTMDVLIDTDPGMGTLGCDPEDSLAITLALASPEVTVRAITCVQGNVPVRHSYANAAHLLQLLGRTDVPLAAGAERPLLGARRGEQLRWLAERDVLDRVLAAAQLPYPEPRAVELILRTARESDGLTIIAIGPLTNVAAALVADPGLADRLERLVVMGGAFEVPGNVTPTAEFNFFMDPEAAQIVLESGVRPVLVGLDVCHQTHLTSRQLAAAGFTTDLGRFVQRACAAWLPATG